MKTVIIYDQVGQDNIKFFVVDGDHTSLNEVYINGSDDEKKVDDLTALIFNAENDYGFRNEALGEFPIQAVMDGAKVIVAGFNP